MHSELFPDTESCVSLCLLANISRYSGGFSIFSVPYAEWYAGGESLGGAVGSAVSENCVSSGNTMCMLVSISLKFVSSSVAGALGIVSFSSTDIEGRSESFDRSPVDILSDNLILLRSR